eukprot:4662066-Pyramimonas_sp.AAC.1
MNRNCCWASYPFFQYPFRASREGGRGRRKRLDGRPVAGLWIKRLRPVIAHHGSDRGVPLLRALVVQSPKYVPDEPAERHLVRGAVGH